MNNIFNNAEKNLNKTEPATATPGYKTVRLLDSAGSKLNAKQTQEIIQQYNKFKNITKSTLAKKSTARTLLTLGIGAVIGTCYLVNKMGDYKA